jgi:hypothetical protein
MKDDDQHGCNKKFYVGMSERIKDQFFSQGMIGKGHLENDRNMNERGSKLYRESG